MSKVHTTRRLRLVLALCALPLPLAILPAPAAAQVSLSIDLRIGYAPPPLPVYDQPPLPGPGYIWVPGTWAWSDWLDDYYWVPGYWTRPPRIGLLWTPAWWGWDNGAFLFHEGYWGPQVGWYGGIDYGHGYGGHGWDGGYWDHGRIWYNRSVTRITVINNTVNVYNRPPPPPPARGPVRVSYSGGAGGVIDRPRPGELPPPAAQRVAATPEQQQHWQRAVQDPGHSAARIVPTWHPPQIHRVTPQGQPIPRDQVLRRDPVGVPPGMAAHLPPPVPRPAFQHPDGPTHPESAPGPMPRPEVRPDMRPDVRPAPHQQARPDDWAGPRPEARPVPEHPDMARPAPEFQRPTEPPHMMPRPTPVPHVEPPHAAPRPEFRPEPRPAPPQRERPHEHR